MSKKGFLLCVCQGTCPSFDKMNFFEILNRLRREGLVDWVGLHPQLCAEDGDLYLQALLQGSDIDFLYVAGCGPLMQRKMFRDAFKAVGFPAEKHIGIEIRNLDTEAVFSEIKKAVKESHNN